MTHPSSAETFLARRRLLGVLFAAALVDGKAEAAPETFTPKDRQDNDAGYNRWLTSETALVNAFAAALKAAGNDLAKKAALLHAWSDNRMAAGTYLAPLFPFHKINQVQPVQILSPERIAQLLNTCADRTGPKYDACIQIEAQFLTAGLAGEMNGARDQSAALLFMMQTFVQQCNTIGKKNFSDVANHMIAFNEALAKELGLNLAAPAPATKQQGVLDITPVPQFVPVPEPEETSPPAPPTQPPGRPIPPPRTSQPT